MKQIIIAWVLVAVILWISLYLQTLTANVPAGEIPPLEPIYTHRYIPFQIGDQQQRILIIKPGDWSEVRQGGGWTTITLNGKVWLSTTMPVTQLPDLWEKRK